MFNKYDIKLLAESLEETRKENDQLKNEISVLKEHRLGLIAGLKDVIVNSGGSFNEQWGTYELGGVHFTAAPIAWDPRSRLSLREMKYILEAAPGWKNEMAGIYRAPNGAQMRIREAYAAFLQEKTVSEENEKERRAVALDVITARYENRRDFGQTVHWSQINGDVGQLLEIVQQLQKETEE